VSAISSWYLYSRTGGIRNNTNYPAGLNGNITTSTRPPEGVNLPERRTLCAPINADISDDANVDTGDGDSHGDMNTFWSERDYVKDASKVKAAVFATHGFQDDNVRMDHEWNWQQALKANGVHTKLWLLRAGHTDPFESRRAVWVDTLHRWFDHYLYGVDNGIEKEPPVTIEDEKDVWHDYASWPIPGTENVDVFLRGSGDANAAGTLGGMTGGDQDSLTFTGTDAFPNENSIISTPEGSQANRRVFLSGKLTDDVRISGQTSIDLVASVPGTQENYGAVIVDYGAGTQVTRSGEGIRDTDQRTCWGDTGNNAVTGEPGPDCTIGAPCEASPREVDTACYLEVSKPTQEVTQWRVTRGTLDSSNRNSLFYTDATPLTPNEKVHLKFPTFATEHTFKAGHQIGVVIVGNLYGARAQSGTPTAASPAQPITIDTKQSKVILPVLGGYKALASAGGTDAETVPPVIGDISADINTHTADPTGIVVNYPTPTVTDNEDPNPSIACTPESGSKFKAGSTVVTCTATDANGNTATKSFTVNVGADVSIGGDVAPTLSLTIGEASFGAFTPGIAKDYATSANATVTSSAGDATLSVSEPGHLMNGTFSLASPLQVALAKSAWTAPVANDNVKVDFTQHIDADEALRTGTYSTTLTFTLSTTNP
jgi:X-Pro dipeptidyl-peptidase